MELLEAMRVRRSVRTYTGEPVPEDILARIVQVFETSERLNELSLRIFVRPGPEVGPAMTGLVGSYGAIRHAPTWLIGVSGAGRNDQVNFGFAMEQMILECTRAGLGTCWVGGFFKKSALSAMVPLAAGERIVCITPVGYAAARRLAERSMRALGGLNTRKPLDERVFHGAWGRPAADHLSSRPALREVFELARWAPSASNKQPCHYVVDGERIVIAVLESLASRTLSALVEDRAEGLHFQGVDAGIAMAHVQLAARAMGIAGVWSLEIDEPELRSRHGLPAEARPIGLFALGAGRAVKGAPGDGAKPRARATHPRS